ncbi:MAG: hypothetical protein AAGD96_28000 [Chloroflexota bacterium]
MAKVQELGFNWVKVFNTPGDRLPVNVMFRLNADSSHLNNIQNFRDEMRNAAVNSGEYIDAYEIGNEVNLDASYGWTSAPEADQYVELLCAAYEEIKAVDPTAIIISAGLAPTGRVTGNWEGHAGHNGLYQDDHEFLREMLDAVTAKGQTCFDAVGYHNYGFDKPYDTSPDCENGFCFRGVEKIYDVMVEKGYGDSQVWTTEFGWIVNPEEVDKPDCVQTLVDQGRGWQMVSLQEQSDNIAGAFDYAAKNWEWMGGLILFNLNFNKAGYYSRCEQMTFYSVEDRPAETALKELPKAYEFVQPEPIPVVTQSGQWSALITADQQPYTMTAKLTISNTGDAPFTYTISISDTQGITPTVIGELSAVVSATSSTELEFEVAAISLVTGSFSSQVSLNTEPALEGYPQLFDIQMVVADRIFSTYLPAITR